MTITISNKELKSYLDAINGAVIGVSKSIESANVDAHTIAAVKLDETIASYLAACKLAQDKVSLFADAIKVRTMRFSKEGVKQLSGTSFRKWAKEWTCAHFDIEFASASGQKKKTVKVDTSIYDEFCAWLESRNNPDNK